MTHKERHLPNVVLVRHRPEPLGQPELHRVVGEADGGIGQGLVDHLAPAVARHLDRGKHCHDSDLSTVLHLQHVPHLL